MIAKSVHLKNLSQIAISEIVYASILKRSAELIIRLSEVSGKLQASANMSQQITAVTQRIMLLEKDANLEIVATLVRNWIQWTLETTASTLSGYQLIKREIFV